MKYYESTFDEYVQSGLKYDKRITVATDKQEK